MLRKRLMDLLEIVFDASEYSEVKIGVTFAPRAYMVTFHIQRTNKQFSVNLNDEDAILQMEVAEDEILDLLEGVES